LEQRVRMATKDDADAIGMIHVRAWQAAYRGIMPDDYLDGLQAEDRVAMWRAEIANPRPDQHLRVITVGGEVVGFANSGPEGDPATDRETGELYAINVDPDHWSRGLGRVLLRDVTAGLADAGYRTAVLWVAVENKRARDLYESEGWLADTPPREAEVFDVTVTEMRYRRQLDV
jgi:ribosomal protein S18 acetylase RimI-like enzyme